MAFEEVSERIEAIPVLNGLVASAVSCSTLTSLKVYLPAFPFLLASVSTSSILSTDAFDFSVMT